MECVNTILHPQDTIFCNMHPKLSTSPSYILKLQKELQYAQFETNFWIASPIFWRLTNPTPRLTSSSSQKESVITKSNTISKPKPNHINKSASGIEAAEIVNLNNSCRSHNQRAGRLLFHHHITSHIFHDSILHV